MKVLISLVFLSLSGLSFAQEKGIKFAKNLNWMMVRDKAKTEGKYIFVDVFATWCGPCKQMDKEVYSSEKIGTFMNDKFVSIKVQADISKDDSELVKSWYSDAERILKEYKINGFPTYLFFSPNGTLVSRGIGFKNVEEFGQLVSEATDSSKQYYSRLEMYKHGLVNHSNLKALAEEAKANGDTLIADKMADEYIDNQLALLNQDKLNPQNTKELLQVAKLFGKDKLFTELLRNYISDQLTNIQNDYQVDHIKMVELAQTVQALGQKETAAKIAADYIFYSLDKIKAKKLDQTKMYGLAYVARDFGESLLANKISQDYINNYLFRLKEPDLLNKMNLRFIGDFLGNEDSKSFKYFMLNRKKIGLILTGLDQPEYKIKSVIATSLPNNLMKKENFNWDSLERSFISKFGLLGKEVVDGKEMIYYLNRKEWKKFGECYYQYFKSALKRPEFNINSISWIVFENVEEVEVLRFACDTVMKYAIEEWYQNDPTSWDTYANLLYKTGRIAEAIKWQERAVKMKMGQPDEKLYTNALERIKKGLPTWKEPTNN